MRLSACFREIVFAEAKTLKDTLSNTLKCHTFILISECVETDYFLRFLNFIAHSNSYSFKKFFNVAIS